MMLRLAFAVFLCLSLVPNPAVFGAVVPLAFCAEACDGPIDNDDGDEADSSTSFECVAVRLVNAVRPARCRDVRQSQVFSCKIPIQRTDAGRLFNSMQMSLRLRC